MNKLLILLAVGLAASACRPSGDRADATESGAVATGGATATARGGDPVAKGAERATPETLPANAVLASTDAAAAVEQPNIAPPASAVTVPPDGNSAGSNIAEPAPAPTIPSQYRGRWGLVPADCTSTRGDNKGLITVGDRTIRFYEATATLKEQLPSTGGRFSGTFSHTGEGQSWETVTSFSRQGDTLTRTEGPQGFTYTRCR
jgi:hypothetical protein